jgi:outer membrane receptor protein involved in Fe transport
VGTRFGDHNVRLTPRYTDGVNDEAGDLNATDAATFEHVEGIWTVDLNWAWQVTASSSISASARNLFAEDPPQAGGAIFNRQRRTYSIQYQHSFAD